MPVKKPVYLDNHATTRVDPRVVGAMLPYFTDDYGNASSVGHVFGDRARSAVSNAAATIAAAINADPKELVFTSGATESNNLAIRGIVARHRRRGNHLISVRTEHAAVLEPLARLERSGFAVTLLDVEQYGSPHAGRLDPQRVADAITEETALVSVMLANNEFGTIQPVQKIADVCRQRGVPLHCDATQAVGRIPVDVRQLGVDLMSFSAHKIYGPKGVGALYVRRSRPAIRLEAQIVGGGQQRGRRGGTINVAGIVGFAAAVQLCSDQIGEEMSRLAALRNRLWDMVSSRVEQLELCGPALNAVDEAGGPLRLPGNLNVVLYGYDGETLMLNMPDVAVSSGAACASSDPGPSKALLALGLSEDLARGSLRFGIGRFNTEEEIGFAAEELVAALDRSGRAAGV